MHFLKFHLKVLEMYVLEGRGYLDLILSSNS